MSEMLTPDQRKANEDAVSAMVSLLGGPIGMVDKGVKMMDLRPILEADPDDDLSGLRLFASRMVDGPSFVGSHPLPRGDEPEVFPEEASNWLVRSGRAVETDDVLVMVDEKEDHLGKAALQIAGGTEPAYLTEAYDVATDSRSPLSPDVIKEIARNMVEEFRIDPAE